MIGTLINKQDTFEIVRDKIADILKTELVNQQQIAVSEGKDPSFWDIRVFSERSNPVPDYQNETDTRSIINVWFESTAFEQSAGGVVEKQTGQAIYNVDCVGYGVPEENGTGHLPGDRQAALQAQAAAKLARNILMAAEYTYLDLRGLVGQRWPQSIRAFQPDLSNRQAQHVEAVRLSLNVRMIETGPQVSSVPLEQIGITCDRKETGELYLEADYDYTT